MCKFLALRYATPGSADAFFPVRSHNRICYCQRRQHCVKLYLKPCGTFRRPRVRKYAPVVAMVCIKQRCLLKPGCHGKVVKLLNFRYVD